MSKIRTTQLEASVTVAVREVLLGFGAFGFAGLVLRGFSDRGDERESGVAGKRRHTLPHEAGAGSRRNDR